MTDKPQIPPGFRSCTWEEATKDSRGLALAQLAHGMISMQGHSLPPKAVYLCPDPSTDAVQLLVAKQAEDEGLWFDAGTAPEAYLQQELRRLHKVIEGLSRIDSEPDADFGDIESSRGGTGSRTMLSGLEHARKYLFERMHIDASNEIHRLVVEIAAQGDSDE